MEILAIILVIVALFTGLTLFNSLLLILKLKFLATKPIYKYKKEKYNV